MSRVGQKYAKRSQCNSSKPEQMRKIERFLKRVKVDRNLSNRVTATMVAHELGLKPSNYVLKMLKDMEVSGLIDVKRSTGAGGRFVWLWSIRERQSPRLWSHEVRRKYK